MRSRPQYGLNDFAPALSARGLKKSFARGLARAARRTVAIENVDIEIHSGEILGIVGSDGCGKTTLIQCLCGLLKTDAGTITLFGQSFEGEGCPRQIAYVPAVPVFYPFLSVRDVLELRAGRNVLTRGRGDLLDRSISAFDLQSVAGCRVGALSRDVLRRVALAEALTGGPDVILVDTNASDLTPAFAPRTLQALEEVAAAGCAIALASRDAASIASSANRIVLVDHGRIARTFALESFGEPIVAAAVPSNGRRFVAERVH